MKHSGFVHLHNHTEYSLLDGASKIKPMLQAAAKMKMPALAISDHGNMFGAVDFFFAAMKAGVKPIIGCEVYIAPGSRFEKSGKHGENYYHLMLLCKDEEGYRNLVKLVSAGYLEGFYYKPRIDKDLLAAHAKGLICLSACLKGEVPNLIIKGKVDEAREAAKYYKELFGEGNYYLELQDHKIEDQYKANEELLKFSKELNLPVVATNDCHYIEKVHSKLHDILLCIQTKRNFSDIDRMRFPSNEFYMKSEEEMRKVFEFVPESLKNTLEITEKCSFNMEEKVKLILPNYEVPESFTLESYFDHLTIEGMKKRYGDNPSKAIVDRTNYELEVIKRLNFAGYFLIVWDFIKYAKDNGIYVGAGRGSVAGSIVAYCLSITETDPLKYSLFFERFLNPERVSPPDIDIDFADDKRDRVMDYVKRKYGEESVAQIITFGSMLAKGVLRDVGRVLSIPLTEVNKIAAMIPKTLGVTLTQSLSLVPELKSLYESDKKIKKLIDNLLDFAKMEAGFSRESVSSY